VLRAGPSSEPCRANIHDGRKTGTTRSPLDCLLIKGAILHKHRGWIHPGVAKRSVDAPVNGTRLTFVLEFFSPPSGKSNRDQGLPRNVGFPCRSYVFISSGAKRASRRPKDHGNEVFERRSLARITHISGRLHKPIL